MRPHPFPRQTLVAALLAASTAACGAAPDDAPGWQPASEPVAPQPEPSASRTTSSLGDPFVLVASHLDPSPFAAAQNKTNAPTPNAHALAVWALLHSDACEVELQSVEVAYRRNAEDSPAWLSTVGPSAGVVVDSSPNHVVVRFDTHVQVQREDGWPGQPTRPATLEMQVLQQGEQVWIHTNLAVQADAPDEPLRVSFVVRGAFDQDPEVIPERRFACPHR